MTPLHKPPFRRFVRLLTALTLVASATTALFARVSNKNPDQTLPEILPRDIDAVRSLGGTDHWNPYPRNPVIKPGKKGHWDAGALGSMSVVKVNGIYHMYYEAWATKSKKWKLEDYHTLQIGHAVSADGVHWIKDPQNPVLPKGKNDADWDKNGTWDPFVIYEDGLFKMWYGGGAHPRCDWGFAVSKDGCHFEKKGRISNLNHVEDDHIVHDQTKNRYYMYYWDRRFEPNALRRAESPNETDFDFQNATPITIQGEKYPGQYKFTHVFIENATWYMFYADFIRPRCSDSVTRFAASPDGLNWKCRNKNLIPGQDAEIVKAAENLYLMYYSPPGYFDYKGCDIRLAVYNGNLDNLAKKPPAARTTPVPSKWLAGPPILLPGAKGAFDDRGVKDPTIVKHRGRWYLFYTISRKEPGGIGCVSAESLELLKTAPRHRLSQFEGKTSPSKGGAPQLFYFEPQKLWYLIYQTKDFNRQPVYSTTPTIDKPESWSRTKNLIPRGEPDVKWIDFWVICDDENAYLFYSRARKDVYVRSTRISDFPNGFGKAQIAFSPMPHPLTEAVHIYKVAGEQQYHMFYETSPPGRGGRRYGLATAPNLLGPWTRVADDYATGEKLLFPDPADRWTDVVSHGEMIRTGCNQRLEYDPADGRFLIQGRRFTDNADPAWSLGIIKPVYATMQNTTAAPKKEF